METARSCEMLFILLSFEDCRALKMVLYEA